ncbi:SWIM zinc finger family protein [Amycolatopsis plumensis]|uniref:SWIM zinc finger family protein n=1 Tax=Amycolatopsis plumensis TaxID=236508 RepID=A0ABV5UI56_9PSEU
MSDDRVRGFPAFGAGGHLARSWWGRAWVRAMEDTALDLRQLKKGRKYAAAGLVGPITVSPGRIAAAVDDADGGPYRTQLRLAELSEADWTRFLDRVASRAGHLAALLDRDLPPDLAEAAGVDLLPGIGDLDPECDCPGWELPCRHAAALSFQASWLLDADPFLLLLMRGKGEREIRFELESRTAPVGSEEPAADRVPGELPSLEEFRPSGAPSIPAAPGVPAAVFELLAANGAARAQALLEGRPWPARRLDAIRLAAEFPSAAGRLGEGAGFERAVAAWRYGGPDGVEVLETPWTPPKAVVAAARAALAEVEAEPVFERNRCTVGEVQLRLDRRGRWHPYRLEGGEWWPAGPPESDPGLLAG